MKTRLRVLRAEREWSQAELAQRVGVARQTICAIETGKYHPKLRLAFKIAQLFGRQIEELFLYDTSPTDGTRQPRTHVKIHTHKDSHAH